MYEIKKLFVLFLENRYECTVQSEQTDTKPTVSNQKGNLFLKIYA